MGKSIFTRIIEGEIPCYKIYEDEKTFAFLDIHPETKGHTLVIPKTQCDKIYDLDDEDYIALMKTVKMLAKHYEEVLGVRSMLKVVGTDVPHAHVHITSFDETWCHGRELKFTDEEMEEIRQKLAI